MLVNEYKDCGGSERVHLLYRVDMRSFGAHFLVSIALEGAKEDNMKQKFL